MLRLLALCTLLLALPASAQEQHARLSLPIAAGSVAAVESGTEEIGNTTIANTDSDFTVDNSNIRCSAMDAPAHSGTLDRVYIMMANWGSSDQDVKIGIYTNSSGPSSKVGTETEFTNLSTSGTGAWVEFTVSYSVTASTDYWICAAFSTSASTQIYYQTSTNAEHRESHTYTDAWPSTFTSSGTDNRALGYKARVSYP